MFFVATTSITFELKPPDRTYQQHDLIKHDLPTAEAAWAIEAEVEAAQVRAAVTVEQEARQKAAKEAAELRAERVEAAQAAENGIASCSDLYTGFTRMIEPRMQSIDCTPRHSAYCPEPLLSLSNVSSDNLTDLL